MEGDQTLSASGVAMAYIEFKQCELPRGRKTQAWEVSSIAGGCLLGYVQWKTGWRRYTFEPTEDTVFDALCLKELAQFLETQTAAQKSRV